MNPLRLLLVCCVVSGAWLAACADSGGASDAPGVDESRPTLLPVADTTVRVGETVRIGIGVNNPTAAALTWSWEGPPLPGLQSAVVLGGTPSGGELVYAPLASHVGTHEFVVRIASSLGDDSTVARVAVLASSASAPVFVRPGPGGTFDLSRDPCVAVPIEIRDDDSLRVDVSLRAGVEGAEVIQRGDKQAELRWCPTASQIGESTRYVFELEAADGVNAPTPHRYIALLLVPAKEGCAGTPPVVSFVAPAKGEEVRSGRGYPVTIDVVDDIGLRDAPVLFWGTTPPEDEENPDLTEFAQTFAVRDGARWVATVPSLGLAPGEQRIVWVVALATDNDDTEGTACDQTGRSEVLRFVAVGAASEAGDNCEACTSSSECLSGLCGLTASGGLCLPSCDATCSSGCVAVTSSAGAATETCGEPRVVCGSAPSDCVDDANEPNNSLAAATPIATGAIRGAICGNDDWFRLSTAAGDQVRVVLDEFVSDNGDLDLALVATDGRVLAQSAGVENREEATACAPPGGPLAIRVLGYDGATNPYRLTVERTAGSCCENDTSEPDNSLAAGTLVTNGDFVDGVICTGDEDWFVFDVASPTAVGFDLVFDSAVIDLEVDLYAPDGRIVSSSRTLGDERIDFTATVVGRYGLRVYGYGASDVGEYIGEISLLGAGCISDAACGAGRRCVAGACVDATCRTSAECGAGFLCSVSEPALAERVCRASCAVNADCGDGACKWYPEGRACGPRGSGANGDACVASADCGGQRACVPWPAGYCARAACRTNADCEPGTWCSDVVGDGRRVCVLDCLVSDDVCRLAEGYVCDLIEDTEGEIQLGCVDL